MKRSPVPLAVTIAVLILLYLPMLVLIMASFNPSRFGGEWTGFSLKWYYALLEERELWESLRTSLIVATGATVVSTTLGTLSALALHLYRSRLQKVHYSLVYIPLVLPDILVGISLLIFFIAIRLQLGLLTVFLTHSTFCLSYVTMVVLARLKHFNFDVMEAAQDLGAGWWYIFRRVLIPLLMPAIVAGALLSFTISLDDFIITFFVAGPGATTLPLYVYSLIKFGSIPIINALSTLLLLGTAILVVASQRLMREYPS